MWNYAFPINKSIWTSSYVVFTAGMACYVLAMTYWAIDRWATPFLVFRTNSIAARKTDRQFSVLYFLV